VSNARVSIGAGLFARRLAAGAGRMVANQRLPSGGRRTAGPQAQSLASASSPVPSVLRVVLRREERVEELGEGYQPGAAVNEPSFG
jgi:hypothetical protein